MDKIKQIPQQLLDIIKKSGNKRNEKVKIKASEARKERKKQRKHSKRMGKRSRY